MLIIHSWGFYYGQKNIFFDDKFTIIDKCTMKFAPFYNTEYDIGQPENDFGNSQSPGSLLSPSVPPFPTSWETLQVVCCPVGLASKYCVFLAVQDSSIGDLVTH